MPSFPEMDGLKTSATSFVHQMRHSHMEMSTADQVLHQRIHFGPSKLVLKRIGSRKYITLKRKKKRKMEENNDQNSKPGSPDSGITPIDEEIDMKPIATLGLGLKNFGVTCYMNSILQIIAHTPPFYNYCLRSRHQEHCKVSAKEFCPMCATQRLVVLSHKQNKEWTIEYTCFFACNLNRIGSDFTRGQQEDAHEFLMQLLDRLETACKRADSEKKIIPQIFGGSVLSKVTCSKCERSSDTEEQFLNLSLNIQTSNCVDEALQDYFAKEECSYFCEHCRVQVDAQKQVSILTAPNILIIQLNRFTFDDFSASKINKKILFNPTLYLTPHMTEMESTRYKLYGMVQHEGGSCDSGHYISLIKNGIPKKWHCLDDDWVYRISGNDVSMLQAYLLFYYKDDSPIKPEDHVSSYVQEEHTLHDFEQMPFQEQTIDTNQLNAERNGLTEELNGHRIQLNDQANGLTEEQNGLRNELHGQINGLTEEQNGLRIQLNDQTNGLTEEQNGHGNALHGQINGLTEEQNGETNEPGEDEDNGWKQPENLLDWWGSRKSFDELDRLSKDDSLLCSKEKHSEQEGGKISSSRKCKRARLSCDVKYSPYRRQHENNESGIKKELFTEENGFTEHCPTSNGTWWKRDTENCHNRWSQSN